VDGVIPTPLFLRLPHDSGAAGENTGIAMDVKMRWATGITRVR